MKTLSNIFRGRSCYLFFIFLFIFGDIICDNYILKSFYNQTHAQQFYSFLGLSVLQMLASPIQAALSDLYCRKKSLVFALVFSLISLVLVYMYIQTENLFIPMLVLIISLKGLFGNILPLSFAAIADVRSKKIRLSFGIATAPYTAGYFCLIFTNKTLSESSSILVAITVFIALVIVCFLFFEDVRDKTENEKQILHIDSSIPTEIKTEFTLFKSDGFYCLFTLGDIPVFNTFALCGF